MKLREAKKIVYEVLTFARQHEGVVHEEAMNAIWDAVSDIAPETVFIPTSDPRVPELQAEVLRLEAEVARLKSLAAGMKFNASMLAQRVVELEDRWTDFWTLRYDKEHLDPVSACIVVDPQAPWLSSMNDVLRRTLSRVGIDLRTDEQVYCALHLGFSERGFLDVMMNGLKARQEKLTIKVVE